MQERQLTTGARARRIAVAAACAVLVALLLPASGSAKRGLLTGVGDGGSPFGDPSQRAQLLDEAIQAKIGIVRVGVQWPNVVTPVRPPDPTNPGSPSYDFSTIDPTVRALASRGVKVLLVLNRAPTWAEGPGRPPSATPGTWKPNPDDLADFVRAVAARYSGSFDPDGVAGPAQTLPSAYAIEVWGEPNLEDWLSPQYEGSTAVSVAHYRNMLNASYQAVKAVAPGILVVTAATGPYGDPPGGPYPPGGARVRPVQFWQQMFCLRPVKKKKGKKKKGAKGTGEKLVRTASCPGKTLFDVFAHHPIDNTGSGPEQSGPHRYDASTPDLDRVVRVLRAAEAAGTVDSGRHPVWVTEFWWDSKPPNSVGAPLKRQARWVEQSLYFFWKDGASVAINFLLRDIPDRENEHAGHQSGLFFADGRPKPALTAFRFPFVTERINQRTLQAWGKAPGGGKLVIQRKAGGRWATVRKLQVAEGAVFVAKLKLSGKQQLRARVGGEQSLVWTQTASATKKSSDGGGGTGKKTIAAIVGGGMLLLLMAAVLRRRHVVRRRQRRRRELRGQRGLRPMTG